MSGQAAPQRVWKSPCAASQGPIRATIPLSSLVRPTRRVWGGSPPASPPSAPDSDLSSPTYKAKCRTLCIQSPGSTQPCAVIRRTASLDAIYLKGQWPRESFYTYCGQLLVNKATQTPEDWGSEMKKAARLADVYSNDEQLEKYIKQKLHRASRDSPRERATPLPADHSVLGNSTGLSRAVSVPQLPRPFVPRIRNSIEGLNQEIEKLILNESGRSEVDKGCQLTPEGHHGPLADLLRSTRSVNTQTPAGRASSQSSGSPSSESLSPLLPAGLDLSHVTSHVDRYHCSSRESHQGESTGSSPEQESSRLGTSPQINRFLAREPPDGCEKVQLKVGEENKQSLVDPGSTYYCQLKPSVPFQLKPSLGSAFYPLQKLELSQESPDEPGPSGTSDTT